MSKVIFLPFVFALNSLAANISTIGDTTKALTIICHSVNQKNRFMYYKSFEKETVSIRHDTKSDLFHINNNNKFILLGSTKFILKTKNFIVSLIFPTDFSATNKFDAHAEYKTLDQEFSEIISLECNSITDID